MLNKILKKKIEKSYTSETAKERPVRGWGAFGGAGWGGGSSWSRSINAPKSAFTALFIFLVNMSIPASPSPSNTHKFADEDAIQIQSFYLLTVEYAEFWLSSWIYIKIFVVHWAWGWGNEDKWAKKPRNCHCVGNGGLRNKKVRSSRKDFLFEICT